MGEREPFTSTRCERGASLGGDGNLRVGSDTVSDPVSGRVGVGFAVPASDLVRFCAVLAQERSLCLSIDHSCLNKSHRRPIPRPSVQRDAFGERIRRILQGAPRLVGQRL